MAKGTVATKYPIDLTGLRFGKLIVIGKGENYCSPKRKCTSNTPHYLDMLIIMVIIKR